MNAYDVILAAIVLIGALLLATLIAAYLERRNEGWLGRQTDRRLVFHTGEGGGSIRGVVARTYADGVVLEHADSLDHDAAIGGTVYIPADRILWVQTDPGGDR